MYYYASPFEYPGYSSRILLLLLLSDLWLSLHTHTSRAYDLTRGSGRAALAYRAGYLGWRSRAWLEKVYGERHCK